VMPCGWGVKAGMVRVWVAGKTVWSPCYTRAISERFRDKELIIKRYINLPSLLPAQSTGVMAFCTVCRQNSVVSCRWFWTLLSIWR